MPKKSCTMPLLFFINPQFPSNAMQWIERIAMTLSGALTARHFLMDFIIVKCAHIYAGTGVWCLHRRYLRWIGRCTCTMCTPMHTFIPDTSIQLNERYRETHRTNESPMQPKCTQQLHSKSTHNMHQSALFWQKREKRQENGDKEEPQNRPHSLTHSPIEIRCVDCLQTLYSIASHQSLFCDFVPVPSHCLLFFCCWLKSEICVIRHRIVSSISTGLFKDRCDIYDFAYNGNQDCYNHGQGLKFGRHKKWPASLECRERWVCSVSFNLYLKMNYWWNLTCFFC